MGLTASFGAATQWWAVYYSDHQMVSLVVRYLHIAALMVGGGTALAIDRLVLGSARVRTDERRQAALNALHGSHVVVVPALIVVTVSGVLMAAADWSTFVASQLFWIKMGSFVLLLANGGALVAAERAFAKGADTRMWRRVILASGTSFLLWLFILWMGEWLTVAA
jgi:uncharacterized membrane protein